MSDVPETIEAVWRNESTRLVAAIARVTRDVGVSMAEGPEERLKALDAAGRMGDSALVGWLSPAGECTR